MAKAGVEAWLRGAGVRWDEAAIEIREQGGYSGPGLGVFAVSDIAEGATLCSIPKARARCLTTTGRRSAAALLGSPP